MTEGDHRPIQRQDQCRTLCNARLTFGRTEPPGTEKSSALGVGIECGGATRDEGLQWKTRNPEVI